MFTSFIAVGFAYAWRGKASAEDRDEFDKAIHIFWRCGTIWLVALGLMVFASITDDTPLGSGKPQLFNFGMLVGLGGQLWLIARSIVGGLVAQMS